MKRVDFRVFAENSSSADAIYQFAIKELPLSRLKEQMWDIRAQAEVDTLKRRGRKRALAAARRWCTSQGYDWKHEI